MSADPYTHHLVALVHGESRVEIVHKLRALAERISLGEAGDASLDAPHGSEGAWLLRHHPHEEAGACRMHAVYRDGEGETIDNPVALFADEDQARRFVEGLPPQDDGGVAVLDAAILRADVAISAWNSYNADPWEAA